MIVVHETAIAVGSTSFEVRVPGIGKTLCAISRNFTLLGYGYTNNTGYALISFNEPVTDEGNLTLVITAYNKMPYTASLTVITGPLFIRGDANDDELVDIGDLIHLINYLYKTGPAPVPLLDAGDVNDDGLVDIGDVTYLINYLYKGGSQPPAPFPNPGVDLTP
jgi:hypothetical protein